MSIEDDIIVKQVTKPEGPAQEPQMCTDCEVDCIGAKCRCPCHRVPATPAPSQPAPDGTCTECGQPNPIWFAPSDIWNRLIPGRVGFLCPRCFALKSPETVWVLQEAEPRVYNTSDAPSQPAGAREWLQQEYQNSNPKTTIADWYYNIGWMEEKLVFLAQQTAAKDAEIERLTKQVEFLTGYGERRFDDAKKFYDRAEAAERELAAKDARINELLEEAVRLGGCIHSIHTPGCPNCMQKCAHKAAERERDSLRELVTEIERESTEGDDPRFILAQIDALIKAKNAALKAWKDGQQ